MSSTRSGIASGGPDPFVVREHGAGEGTLAAPILDGLAADRSALLDAIRYEPVEVEPRAPLEAFAARLASAASRRSPSGPASPAIVGVVLANEVLDALPVHRVERRDGTLRELLVGWEGGRFLELSTATDSGARGPAAAEGVQLGRVSGPRSRSSSSRG